MGYGTDAIVFLIQTLFGLYLMAIMLRVLLQVTRADFYNPVCQFLVKVTNPPLIPLRRLIPGFGGIDFAAIVLMLVIQLAQLFLITLIRDMSVALTSLSLLAIAELLYLLANVFLFAILIQVVISWVNPGTYNPVVSLLYSLTEPLLGRARRLLPPISGFDLSPIIALIALQLIKLVMIKPIEDIALGKLQLW
jgi:YggT family protein